MTVRGAQITCTRRIEFDAAHRVLGHESKCANLHGHRYVVEITAQADDGLDGIGRVIDFSVIKSVVGEWIDDSWDHTAIMYSKDEGAAALVALQKNKPVFIAEWNPTAENMAWYLLHVVCPTLLRDHKITVTHVRVYETPNCYADAKLL